MGDERAGDYRHYRQEQLGLRRPPLVDTPRAREADRATSHQAAAAIKASGALGEQQHEALDAVQRWPGKTTPELAQRRAAETGEHWEAVSRRFGRRLSELNGVHIDGPPDGARRCAVSGRRATTWWPR